MKLIDTVIDPWCKRVMVMQIEIRQHVLIGQKQYALQDM